MEAASAAVCIVVVIAEDAQVLGVASDRVADSKHASPIVANAAVVWAAVGRDWPGARWKREARAGARAWDCWGHCKTRARGTAGMGSCWHRVLLVSRRH